MACRAPQLPPGPPERQSQPCVPPRPPSAPWRPAGQAGWAGCGWQRTTAAGPRARLGPTDWRGPLRLGRLALTRRMVWRLARRPARQVRAAGGSGGAGGFGTACGVEGATQLVQPCSPSAICLDWPGCCVCAWEMQVWAANCCHRCSTPCPLVRPILQGAATCGSGTCRSQLLLRRRHICSCQRDVHTLLKPSLTECWSLSSPT